MAGKWGYIDASGKVIVEPCYGTVRYVNDGVAWVNAGGSKQYMVMHAGGKWGIIDARGTVLVEPRFRLWNLNDFSCGVAWVQAVVNDARKASWGIVNAAGEYILPPEQEFDIFPGPTTFHDSVSHVYKDGKVGLVDVTGKFLHRPSQFNDISWFEGDRAWVHEGGTADAGYWGDGIEGGKWGLMNRQGEIVVPPRYDDHHYFSESVAFVNRGGKREEPDLSEPYTDCRGGTWGLIDTDGRMLIDYSFEETNPFGGGMALVKKGEKWGYIDKSGKFIKQFDQKFDGLNRAENGLLLAKRGEKYGYIDESGTIILGLTYDKITGSGAIKGIKEGKTWKIFDTANRRVIVPEVPCDLNFCFSDGYADVTIAEKHGIMNPAGKMVVEAKYGGVDGFKGGSMWVNLGGDSGGFSGLRGGKWGLVDEAGQYIIEPAYDPIYDLDDVLTEVHAGDKWGYVNRKGEEVWFQDH